MNLYKVYIRNAGALSIIFVNSDSLVKIPQEVYRRYESGAIIKVVQMYTHRNTSIIQERSI